MQESGGRRQKASNEVATRWSNLIPRRIGATWPAFDSSVYSSLLVAALLGWVLVPQMGPAHQASELLLQLAPLISLCGLDWIFPLCHARPAKYLSILEKERNKYLSFHRDGTILFTSSDLSFFLFLNIRGFFSKKNIRGRSDR